jgi:beta-lysine N6-acetyltransferase
MNYDKIEQLPCGSLIQHGPNNKRIYLLKASDKDLLSLPQRLIRMANKNGYGKIFVKESENHILPFLIAGFTVEARIPGMYPREKEGVFLSYYLDENRKIEDDLDLYENNLQLAFKKPSIRRKPTISRDFKIRPCSEDDIPAMQAIYREVFPTYPFPIHEGDYLLKTMKEDVDYFCVMQKSNIIALSSAEKDSVNRYVEMTDFATLDKWRGNALAVSLLYRMEKEMSAQGYQTAFTIARAASPGMNITFAKAGYHYAGRLKNNTNISGHIESMNIWYRSLN